MEVDGATHFQEEDYLDDLNRDRQMTAIGLKVVRIIDSEVKRNPIEAAQYIFFKLGLDVPDL